MGGSRAMARMSSLAVSGYLLLALGNSLGAQTPAKSKSLDDFIRAQMTERRIPGMQIAVIRNGRVEKIGAYGYANLDFDLKVQPSTLFSVASISKSPGRHDACRIGKIAPR